MFRTVIATLIAFSAFAAQGETIKSSKETLSPSSIEQVYRLVSKDSPGSSLKKLQIVTTDHGMSTDVSPRYSVYLGLASLAEMGNIFADFKITDTAFRVLGAKRISAGHYEVVVQEYGEDGFLEKTYAIDATQLFADEAKARKQCGGDFCDLTLESTLSVKTTSKKVNP